MQVNNTIATLIAQEQGRKDEARQRSGTLEYREGERVLVRDEHEGDYWAVVARENRIEDDDLAVFPISWEQPRNQFGPLSVRKVSIIRRLP